MLVFCFCFFFYYYFDGYKYALDMLTVIEHTHVTFPGFYLVKCL